MRQAVRFSSGLALLVGLLLIPAALAEDEQLQKAKDLFDRQEYVAAQEALLEVDAEQLTEEESQAYEHLLKVLPQAIQASKKAEQDMADANKAYEEGRWEEADRLYSRVIENEYARDAMREEAGTQRQRIAEKKELAEAAKPTGPVPEQPRAELEQPPAEPGRPEVKPEEEPAAPPPPAAPRRRTLVDELRARDELLWQRAVGKMKEAAQKAGEAVAAERFDKARQWAESALQVIEANRAYAQPPSKYEAARAVALDLKKSVAQAHDEYSRRRADEQREAIRKLIDEREAAQKRQRQEKVDQLFNTGRRLNKEQRFREAAEAMRQVLILDPTNTEARYLLDAYEDYASFDEQKEVRRDIGRQMQRVLQEADEVRIPWTQDILYPKNWMEIISRPTRTQVGTVGPGQDFELNRMLESIQPEVNFEELPFDQAIGFLTELNKMNIAVDWEDLVRNGVDRDKPISLRLKEVSLRTVLNELLTQVGGDVPLSFSVGEGLLRIATKEKLDRNKYFLVYDIRDLIVSIPRFASTSLLDGTGSGAARADSGNPAGSPDSLFGSRGSADLPRADAGGAANREIVETIMDIVRQTVEPDSWRETGGDGSLRELNGQLIVYNTSEAHQQTRALLAQLREARALMIGVESRFLVVGSNFLEEIGVDLDFVFNSGTAGFDPAFTTGTAGGLAAITDPFTGAQVLMPRPFSQIGVLPAIPAIGGAALPQVTPLQPYGQAGLVPSPGGILPTGSRWTPITAQQSAIDLADPRFLQTGIPGTFAQQGLASGLNIAGSFLDNLQVDFLIRATQANKRSSIVQAPRLMMFNGQRAYVAVIRNRQYVSSVTPSVAEGAVGVQPTPGNAQSGTTLDVEGTISADRKYVTITVRTDTAKEPDLLPFQVQRASGNSPGIFILLPTQERTVIRTTVSVPDGGTVLLGGLKQVGEVEVEAGVPILSKIPILKRAFTNTSRVKDTQTLLILLKAKILIQKEAEEEAFPALSSLQPG